MIPRWLVVAAVIVLLWTVLSCIAAPFIGAWIARGAREMPPPEDEP